MPRNTYIANATIQFDNPIQSPQWGAPVLLTSICVITNDEGLPLYQPNHRVEPATAEDVTDELLAALNVKLGALGLEVARKQQ